MDCINKSEDAAFEYNIYFNKYLYQECLLLTYIIQVLNAS